MAALKTKSLQAYPLKTSHDKYVHICKERQVKPTREVTDFIEREIKKHSSFLTNFKVKA